MRYIQFFITLSLLLFLSACGSSDLAYQGTTHPKSSSTRLIFEEHNVPDSCNTFAHLMMHTRANATGQALADAMRLEAMEKGADLVLVGLARDDEEAELDENRFDYYGPDYSYNFNKTWLGWKFGFNEWNEGGELRGFGTDTSSNRETLFPHTMMVQAVFLRCQTI